MSEDSKAGHDLIEIGAVVYEERKFVAEFKLKLADGEQRIVKYTERKTPQGEISYFGLAIDLSGDLEGNVFRESGGDPVSAVFTKHRGRSLPFGMNLGESIRERFGPELILAFSAFLSNEGYSFASLLWEDALAISSSDKGREGAK